MCCNLTLPSDVAHFMDSNHSNIGQVTVPREVTVDDEDDDVPMLSMEDSPLYVGMAITYYLTTISLSI